MKQSTRRGLRALALLVAPVSLSGLVLVGLPAHAHAVATATRTSLSTAAQPAYDPAVIKEFQTRLALAGIWPGQASGVWTQRTRQALIWFQRKNHMVVSGRPDTAVTLKKLRELTRYGNGIHPACREAGKIICVNRSLQVMRVLESNKILWASDARFGKKSGKYKTTGGIYWVFRNGPIGVAPDKVTEQMASTYRNQDGALMPFPLTYNSLGQAVHFSPTFAAAGIRGYESTSLGCVNTRDYEKMKAIWKWADVHRTKVIVYDTPVDDLAALKAQDRAELQKIGITL